MALMPEDDDCGVGGFDLMFDDVRHSGDALSLFSGRLTARFAGDVVGDEDLSHGFSSLEGIAPGVVNEVSGRNLIPEISAIELAKIKR